MTDYGWTNMPPESDAPEPCSSKHPQSGKPCKLWRHHDGWHFCGDNGVPSVAPSEKLAKERALNGSEDIKATFTDEQPVERGFTRCSATVQFGGKYNQCTQDVDHAGNHKSGQLDWPKRAHQPSAEVNHPSHYTAHPSGIECIAIVEAYNFNVGNAIKYIWRAGLKSPDAITDLEKSRWYIDREIQRLKAAK